MGGGGRVGDGDAKDGAFHLRLAVEHSFTDDRVPLLKRFFRCIWYSKNYIDQIKRGRGKRAERSHKIDTV